MWPVVWEESQRRGMRGLAEGAERMEPRTFDRAGAETSPAPAGWRRALWWLGGAILAGLAALALRGVRHDDEKPVTRYFLPGEAIVALRRRAGQPLPGTAEARAVVAHLNRVLLRQGLAAQVTLAE